MNLKVKQGDYMKKVKATNRANVKKWFKDNPGSTITECCKGLSLSYRTVRDGLNELITEIEG